MTAEEWRELNPELAKQDKNIRDYASENNLTVLADLETHNAQFIKEGIILQQKFKKRFRTSVSDVLGNLKTWKDAKFNAKEFVVVNTNQLYVLNKLGLNFNSYLDDILRNSLKINDASRMHFLLTKAIVISKKT